MLKNALSGNSTASKCHREVYKLKDFFEKNRLLEKKIPENTEDAIRRKFLPIIGIFKMADFKAFPVHLVANGFQK